MQGVGLRKGRLLFRYDRIDALSQNMLIFGIAKMVDFMLEL